MSKKNETQTNTNFATANDFAKMLNGNYRTVVKILTQMKENGEIEEGTIQKHKRVVKAYSYNNDTIKKIQKALLSIRNPQKSIAYNKNDVVNNNNANINGISTTNRIQLQNENVTIYEVTKKNNELENALNDYKTKVSTLEVEKTKIEADLYKLQSDYKLIEDKQATFEGEYSRLKQENEKLQNTLRIRERIISVFVYVVSISITILTMYFLMRR